MKYALLTPIAVAACALHAAADTLTYIVRRYA